MANSRAPTTTSNQMPRVSSRRTTRCRHTGQRDATRPSQPGRQVDPLERVIYAIGERQDLESILQVVVRSLEDNMPIDFACICLYDAAERRLSRGHRPQGMTRAPQLQLEPGGGLPIDQNGLSRCVRGVLVYEPDTRALGFPFRTASRGGTTFARGGAAAGGEPGVRRADRRTPRGGELQQRRLRVPAAAERARGARDVTRRSCTPRCSRPMTTCARRSRPCCSRSGCARSARWRAASRTTSTTRSRRSRCTRSRCSSASRT